MTFIIYVDLSKDIKQIQRVNERTFLDISIIFNWIYF